MKSEVDQEFAYTKVSPNLPPEIEKGLRRIINYRFGVLPESNMLTTEVFSYVEPDKVYRFNVGSLTEEQSPLGDLAAVPEEIQEPKYLEFKGDWTAQHSYAREEANVLGSFSTLYVDAEELTIPLDQATPEKLAYYDSILLESDQSIRIKAPYPLPVNVVKFDKNYEHGYLKLASHGGGYYLEKHDTPHLWSHRGEGGGGVIILGKEFADETYHLTAFRIPYGAAIYAQGGVIHSDGLLVGEVMAIYTVTPDYSTVILKQPNGDLVDMKLSVI